MRSKDTLRRDTLRFVLAAIQREGVDRRQATVDKLIGEGKDEAARLDYLAKNDPNDLDDAGVQDVLQKQAKMRRDSIEAFQKGGRTELVDKETKELAVIAEYLPKQMSESEIRAVVAKVIADTGASGPRDMGKAIKHVMSAAAGRADGRRVSAKVKEALG